METQQTRFRVEVKHPDEIKDYLLKLDSETPDGESIDYPRLRAAQTIKLNFLIDIPQDKFREVSGKTGLPLKSVGENLDVQRMSE